MLARLLVPSEQQIDYLTVQIEIKLADGLIRLHIDVETADECQANLV